MGWEEEPPCLLLPTVFAPDAGCQDRGRVSLISRVVTRRRRKVGEQTPRGLGFTPRLADLIMTD